MPGSALMLPALADRGAPFRLAARRCISGVTSCYGSEGGIPTTSPKTPIWVSACARSGLRASSRVDHAGRGEQRLRQLGQAALALVQGLPADVAGTHARLRSACGASSVGGFLRILDQLFVGGTPGLALLNPIFWILMVWFIAASPTIMLISCSRRRSTTPGSAWSAPPATFSAFNDWRWTRFGFPAPGFCRRPAVADVLGNDVDRRDQGFGATAARTFVLGKDGPWVGRRAHARGGHPGRRLRRKEHDRRLRVRPSQDEASAARISLRHVNAPLLLSLVLWRWLLLLPGAGQAFQGDAYSRVGNAYYVLFSRDPHLAAIGFVWGHFLDARCRCCR